MTSSTSSAPAGRNDPSPATQKVLLGVGWLLVGVPLVYGLVQTLRRVVTLFTG
ncbi:hypothetical protein WDZ17_03845 [Pseudokineococcus basanitobsidens]|uniref:Uncharacterized protein n=1 Tax=Pseudokineococcus basanitobsidens TaxID=1926649 RepID=A0ABU8RHB5_9ACTN